MKTWKEFFSLLEKNGLFKPSIDFSFEGDFGEITEFGPTNSIEGFYSSPTNFFFNLYGRHPAGQVQITQSQSNDKYLSHKLFIKMLFSDIDIS